IHLALQLSPLPLRLEPLAACAVRATGGLILLRDGLKKLNHYTEGCDLLIFLAGNKNPPG
ncbi:hypothetical protein, partial [Pseudomonas sp. TNT3]|uniref:hypothetical protein n=1 Tax=Pseudomonas sp. TNT3 TaxID=2654097 RepID=UPI001C49A7A0